MKLRPFFPNPFSGSLGAHISVVRFQSVRLEFSWDAEWPLQGVPEKRVSTPGSRVHELWKSTCFEAFIALQNERYLEFNLSPAGLWNVYEFENYRTPQPPQPSDGWSLEEFESGPGHCRGRFSKQNGLFLDPEIKKLQINLTSVTQALNGTMNYWALQHPEKGPDFHDRRGFINWSL
ncbi:MAG: DOMON-like domain-containing protein [Oligoflexia bacterium]|jgi:hypothetical protein